MKYFKEILLFVLITAKCIISCSLATTIDNVNNPCDNIKDTTYKMYFLNDTNMTDFYKLLNFIESKGEFSRFDKKNRIDSSTRNNIILQKLLCEEEYFDSPIETWILEGVISTRYFMTSRKAVKGHNNFYPKFDITQYNFRSEDEKIKAIEKINEIGWGDPLKKWNDYYIISDKTRIIILQSYVTMFGETKNRYGKLIENEWITKNSH